MPTWPQLISDYSFELPSDLIAQSPSPSRSDSRLLVVRLNPKNGMPQFEDLYFKDLPSLVAETPSLKNALWVRNRTSVMPARFFAQRPTGGKHEIVLLDPVDKDEMVWNAIIRGVSDFKFPQKLIEPITGVEFISPERNRLDFSQVDWCRFNRPRDVKYLLEEVGKFPLPPYIQNYTHERDKDRYQTIWREKTKDYSSAAPTASLHFDESVLRELEKIPITWADVLLHVGLGTFEPLRSPNLYENTLHWENFELSPSHQKLIKDNCDSILAVGTTALRCVESFLRYPDPSTEMHFESNGYVKGRTQIFINPQNPPRNVQHLLTNFHLPESSLFVLIATFCESLTLAKETYAHAVAKKYRFFSYGDATLWIR